MEWKPIETAPKDGTVVLGYDPTWYDFPTIMFFEQTFNEWQFWHVAERIRATHWMPLPPPPKDAA